MRKRKIQAAVEQLESRQLLSVSAASLAFSLTKGTQWTTEDVADNVTDTFQVIGNTKFNGYACTEFDDVSTTPGNPTTTDSAYYGFDSAGDLVGYGDSQVSTDNTQTPPVTTTQTSTAAPPIVQYPASMTAGTTYNYSSAYTILQVEDPGSTTTTNLTFSESVKLVSQTLQPITVPAQKTPFMCYEIIKTTKEQVAGSPIAIDGTTTEWVAPGYYPIKQVDDTVVNGNDEGTTTTVLTSTKNVVSTPTQLAFSTEPVKGAVGAALLPAVRVAVEDSTGSAVLGDSSTVTLAIASGPSGGVLSGTTSVAASGGVATFSNLLFSKPGTYTIKATDGKLPAVTSTSFTITAATIVPTKLAFGVLSSIDIAGKPLSPAITVDVESSTGAIVTTESSTVTLSLASGTGTLAAMTAKAVDGIATFNSVVLTKEGDYSFKAVDGSLTSATSSSIFVTAAAAAKLAFIVTPITATVGSPVSPPPIVEVEDAYGNPVTTNSSTISIALASGPGTLTGTKSAAATSGQATFSNLILSKVGSYTLKATDGSLTAATSASFTVNPAVASKLVLVNEPTTTVAGKAITPALIVELEDSFGDIVTTNTSSVTVSVASGTGTLSGTETVTAKAGVATLSNLILDKAGTYTLKAVAGSLTGTSAPFTVTPAAAAKVVFMTLPSTGKVNTALSAVAISVEDAFGNIVTTDISTVTISLATAPTGGTLTGTTTVTAVNGVAKFSNLKLSKVGSYTLKALDGKLTDAISSAIKLT